MVELSAETINDHIDAHGYAVVRDSLSDNAMRGFVDLLDDHSQDAVLAGNAAIEAETAPLTVACDAPTELEALRRELYGVLAPIANRWMEQMGFDVWYAGSFEEFLRLNVPSHHHPFRARLSRLRPGQGGLLQAQVNGALTFPLQVVALLSQPSEHFEGGSLVQFEQGSDGSLTEKIVPIQRGDLAVVPVWTRPRLHSDGRISRLMVKRLVKRVDAGVRDSVELLFSAPR